MADVFFSDEELDWWGDVVPGTGTAPAVAAPRPLRRRPPPRTLAGDLRRLRADFERRSPVPAAAAGLAALALVAALAVVVRLSLGEEVAPAESVRAAAATPSASPQATPAVAAPPPAEQVVLEPGARGARVRDLQAALTELGLSAPADGDYGAGTATAVAGFQSARGLTADGVAGAATADALRAALAERAGEDAAAVNAGIDSAAAQGRLDPETAEQARAAVAAAVEAIGTQAPGRAAVIGATLHDVAAFADSYADRRAPLFAELAAIVRYPPRFASDRVFAGSGVVYRSFPGQGYRFHPLANAGRLDRLAEQGRREAVRRLAPALAARGLRRGNALVWEYRFPFAGSPEAWTSGFAQSVAAQALAKAGKLLGDESLTAAAKAAFRAVPRDLTLTAGGGPWVQEYSFSDLAVLNAHLQSILSLLDYVELTGDEKARAYAAELDRTARSALPSLDTGCWSLYSLGGRPATVAYHSYHVDLLDRLAARTGSDVYRDTGARWRGYLEAGGC
ncbi:MAG TPA: D-glucuronyl C5-epimerase family protein [Gaiellaceae bacterium]|nr:D-glucuronyl C5-epimerase family protein [Gaiellaceae bacterium]